MSQLNSLSDQELISLLNQGDRKAFKMIYKANISDLYKHLRSMVARKEDCEEIIQDVFEKLWLRHATIKVEAIRPYLITSVKHRMLDYFRQSEVKKKHEDQYKIFSAIYDSVDGQEQNPEMTYQIMEEGIQKLPEKLQKVIKLRLEENLSNKEIAERLNLTRGSVDTYVHNINVRLRQAFKDFYKTSS